MPGLSKEEEMKPLQKTKQDLRKEIELSRNSQSAGDRQAADARLCSSLAALPELKKSGRLAAFYPAKGEPDLRPFLEKKYRHGTELCFPRHRENLYELAEIGNFAESGRDFESCFRRGRYGIPEPKQEFPCLNAENVANLTWLVPGVAFDQHGHRLGRGGGIYDRLLKTRTGLKIGISYKCQIKPAVPVNTDDISVDLVVTETGTYRRDHKEE